MQVIERIEDFRPERCVEMKRWPLGLVLRVSFVQSAASGALLPSFVRGGTANSGVYALINPSATLNARCSRIAGYITQRQWHAFGKQHSASAIQCQPA